MGVMQGAVGRDTGYQLLDVLLLLEGDERSGCLKLQHLDGASATIHFLDGRLIDAEFGDWSGIWALGEMIRLRDWHFFLSIHSEDLTVRLEGRVTELVRAAMKTGNSPPSDGGLTVTEAATFLESQ